MVSHIIRFQPETEKQMSEDLFDKINKHLEQSKLMACVLKQVEKSD